MDGKIDIESQVESVNSGLNSPSTEFETEITETVESLSNRTHTEFPSSVKDATQEEKASHAFEKRGNKAIEKLANFLSENKEVVVENDKLVDELAGKVLTRVEQMQAEKIAREIQETNNKKAEDYINTVARGQEDVKELIKDALDKIKPSGDPIKDIDLSLKLILAESGIKTVKATQTATSQSLPKANIDLNSMDTGVAAVYKAMNNVKDERTYY